MLHSKVLKYVIQNASIGAEFEDSKGAQNYGTDVKQMNEIDFKKF